MILIADIDGDGRLVAPVARRPHQQIDLDGQYHDIAPEHERMRLFEPAPVQMPGQTDMGGQ